MSEPVKRDPKEILFPKPLPFVWKGEKKEGLLDLLGNLWTKEGVFVKRLYMTRNPKTGNLAMTVGKMSISPTPRGYKTKSPYFTQEDEPKVISNLMALRQDTPSEDKKYIQPFKKRLEALKDKKGYKKFVEEHLALIPKSDYEIEEAVPSSSDSGAVPLETPVLHQTEMEIPEYKSWSVRLEEELQHFRAVLNEATLDDLEIGLDLPPGESLFDRAWAATPFRIKGYLKKEFFGDMSESKPESKDREQREKEEADLIRILEKKEQEAKTLKEAKAKETKRLGLVDEDEIRKRYREEQKRGKKVYDDDE